MGTTLQRVTKARHWSIVSANEPADERSVRGFVSVLEYCAPEGTPLEYQLMFFDFDGRALDHFEIEEFRLFACAAGLAQQQLGLPTTASSPDHAIELISLEK